MGMKKSHVVSVSIMFSIVVAVSVTTAFILSCSSGKYGIGSFSLNSDETGISVVELITNAARSLVGRARAVFSFLFSSIYNSTAIETKRENNEPEQVLASARAAIRKAASTRNKSTIFKNNVLSAQIYRNPDAFYRSYVEMERKFKIYVYKEGELPLVHDGPCKEIYSSEGRFIHEIEQDNNRFTARNPEAAHVYFMPFSVTLLVKYLFQPETYNVTFLPVFVSDYAPDASKGNALVYNTSIRVLCNANTSEGFNPMKDVSLPEIKLHGGEVNSKLLHPPPFNSSRQHLAFFAGRVHGPIRPILLKYWKDKDSDMQVHEYLSKDKDYNDFMLRSRFCLCPSGFEVASPRIVEAIYAECIPVTLSVHYALPFSDVLRWEAFSLQVDVSEIPRLKEILTAVSEDEYTRLKKGVRAVRRHFELNNPVKRFDMFHMILHSIWLRRLNLRLA